MHEHLFRRIRRLQRIANHLRKHTCPQRTLLLGYPDTHQVPRSPTQQEGQRFVLRSPSAVWCLCRLWTVTRRSYSSPGGGGCSRVLPLHRACKLAQFIPRASRTYPTHLPRSLLTRGIVQGWRRESAVFGSGRWESDAQPPRTHQPVCSAAPAHCQSDPLLIFACHSQLGEYKTLEGKRKSLFRSFLLQIVLNWPIA